MAPKPEKLILAKRRGFRGEMSIRDLDRFMGCAEPLVDDVKVKFENGEGRMFARTIDAAHVALVEVWADKDAFRWVDAPKEPIELALDRTKVQAMAAVLNAPAFGDGHMPVTIEHLPGENMVLFVEGKAGFQRKMELADTAHAEDPKVPNLKWNYSATVDLRLLVPWLKSVTFTNQVSLLVGGADLVVFAEEDGDNTTILFKDAVRFLQGGRVEKGGAKANYDVHYLKSLAVSAMAVDPMATLQWGVDYPVEIRAQGGGLRVRYILAPRIENG